MVSTEQIVTTPAVVGRMRAAASCEAFTPLDFLFHQVIIDQCGNPLFAALFQASMSLYDQHIQAVNMRTSSEWALDKIVQTFKADVEAYGLKRVMVHYIGDKNPAVAWAREVVEPLVGHAVDVLPVSPVIGLHVGPAVGIAYECARSLTGKITGSVTARAVAL